MTALVLIFAACCVVFALAVFVYCRAENTAASESRQKIKELIAKQIEMESRLTGNTTTTISGKAKIESFLAAADERFKKFSEELQVFREQVADTREKQIQIRELVASKRPVFKLTGAIPIEIHTPPTERGKGVGALIKGKNK